MKKKDARNQLEVSGITRQHWNMWRDCPDDELEECLVYECAKRSDLWPLVMETMRRIGNPQEYTPNDSSWTRMYELLCLFPEFPDSPWLAIPALERSRRLRLLSERARRWRAVEIAEEAPFFNPPPIKQATESEGPFWERGIEILPRYRSRSFEEAGTIRRFRVDWLRTNEEIAAEFHQWVDENRPSDYGAYNLDGKPIKGPDAFRRWLRQLGAWTISPHTNYQVPRDISRNTALEDTRYDDEDGVSSKLYSTEKEIRDAEKAAIGLIRRIMQEYILLRHRKTKPIPTPHLQSVDGNPRKFTVTLEKKRFVKFERSYRFAVD